MTDRLRGVVVTFGQDIRVDDAEAILSAIRMIKGVVDVQPVVASYEGDMAEARVNQQWREKLYALIREDRDGKKRDGNG